MVEAKEAFRHSETIKYGYINTTISKIIIFDLIQHQY